MKDNLLFTLGYQGEESWVVLANEMSTNELDATQMLTMLDNIYCNKGGARLEHIPEPDIGVSELKVRCDGEKYLLDLVEYAEDGELILRMKADGINELDGSELIGKLALFEGDGYPIYNVTKNFDFVKKVFIEFLETGNVSYDLMR